MKKSLGLKVNEYCVYRTHGVGKVKEIQEINVGGILNMCFTVFFEKEKMTMTVPASQVENGSLRKISSLRQFEEAFGVLRNGARRTKGTWNRRSKEYEEKINSGDITQVAEVVRDLTREVDESDRSYSERIVYETAVYRMASEYAIAGKLSLEKAQEKIIDIAKERLVFVDIGELEKKKEA